MPYRCRELHLLQGQFYLLIIPFLFYLINNQFIMNILFKVLSLIYPRRHKQPLQPAVYLTPHSYHGLIFHK